MNNTPTPETDAVAEKINFGVDIDFARKLERERDEAQRELEMWKFERDEAMEHAACYKLEANKLIMMGIELREQNAKLREVLEWIAERYDDSKPMHQVAMDAYEMSCTARAILQKEETKWR